MTILENDINPVVQDNRIIICIDCENKISESVPHCQLCNKPISMLTSEQNEICPLNKW